MTNKEERAKRTKAALYTVAINAVVFLVLFFAAAWKTAGSGEGEYPGIEVNLGYDEQGSGNIQPDTEIGTEDATDTENPPSDPVQQPQQDIPEPTAVPEESNTKVVQPATVTDPNSDVEIREEKKDSKPVEKPIEKVPEKKVEKPVEKVIEKPVIDKTAVYQGKTSTTPATSGEGDGKQGAPGNEGDDPAGTAGDKGVEGGIEGAGVYKGKPGGGDGGTLELNGWDWDNIPKPQVPSNEQGRVVFVIKVDDNGDLIEYKKESGSVSAAAERACVQAIQRLTFTKKAGAKVPPVSTGRITFVIRSQ